jgi:hypothetical protein
MERAWRGVAIGAGVLFAVFGLVQLNDPDPFAWVFVYGATAVYSFLSATDRLPAAPPTVWGLLALFFGLRIFLSWDGASNPMGAPEQGLFAEEVVRESLGLFLVAGWSGILAGRAWWAEQRPGSGQTRRNARAEAAPDREE